MSEQHWYKDAIIYELDVETFQDGDGDGVGDLKGLTARLDYLRDLGATCLWLMPIYATPNRDNGYDVTDYQKIDPRLGTLHDFETLLKEAARRDLRVILDLPINDTSNEHPWFQEARKGPGNPYFDFYLWRKEPPPQDGEASFGGSTWSYDDQAGLYYYHTFYPFQPDLNVANPKVREAFREILHFWLSFDISGFRMDAVPFLINQPGIKHPFSMLQEMHKFVRAQRKDAVLLGEVNEPPRQLSRYFGADRKDAHLDMLLNFYLCERMFLALATQQAGPVRQAWHELPRPPGFGQYANFLRNNDELSLDRLSRAEQDEVYAAFAPQKDMRIYGRGIRRRTAPMLGGDGRRMRLAQSLLLSMPGTPVLYYGEELGMGDDLSLDQRNSVRTVMQWNAGPGGGFSSAPPATFPRGLIQGGPFGNQKVNAEDEARDPESLLNWTRRALSVRKTLPPLAHGHFQPLDTRNEAVLAHCCARGGQAVVALHNLSGEATQVTLPQGGTLREVFADAAYSAPQGQPLDLGPYGFRWFREEGA